MHARYSQVRGEFTLSDVKPGHYDFKATKSRYESVVRTVILSQQCSAQEPDSSRTQSRHIGSQTVRQASFSIATGRLEVDPVLNLSAARHSRNFETIGADRF